jgi:hypothetical protein
MLWRSLQSPVLTVSVFENGACCNTIHECSRLPYATRAGNLQLLYAKWVHVPRTRTWCFWATVPMLFVSFQVQRHAFPAVETQALTFSPYNWRLLNQPTSRLSYTFRDSPQLSQAYPCALISLHDELLNAHNVHIARHTR